MSDRARIHAAPIGRLVQSKYCFLFLVVFFASNVHYLNRTVDDAFIVFRYAENIAIGRGWVFTEGERVEAYSSFLWTALLAIGAVLGAAKTKIGLVVAAKFGGILCGLCTLLCVAATARFVSPRTRSPSCGTIAVAFLALSAPFSLWTVGGLETPLAALLGTLAVHFQVRDWMTESRPQVWPRSALLFALGVLTRPEIFFLSLVTILFELSRQLWERTVQANLASNLRWLAGFMVPCLGHLLWRHAYYGQWLPNTYYAKVAGDPLTWVRGTTYLSSALVDLGLGAFLIAALVPFAFARRLSVQAAYLLALIATHLLVVSLEGGDWMPAFRFFVPILPLVALLADAGVSEAFERFTTRTGHWLTTSATLVMLATTSCLGFRSVPSSGIPSGFRKWSPVPIEQEQIARWMNDHLPRRGLLALGEAGVIPYYTDLPVLDLFGLADRHIAHLPGIRHHKFDVDYVLGRKPAYVLFYGRDLRGKPIFTYSEDLSNSLRFRREYRVSHEFRAFTLYERAAVAEL